MDLRGYFQLLLRRWPVLVVTMLVAMGIAYTTTDRTARYQTGALLLVSPERFDLQSEGSNVSFDRIAVIDRLLLTYSRMIQSDTVASGAAHRINNIRSAESIRGATLALPVPQTQLLNIIVTDSDPAAARDISNAVAQSFIDAVNAAPSANATGVIPGGVPVTIFEQARLPVAPLGTRLISNLILGGVFGLLIAAGACIAADAFDLSPRSVRDTERRLGVPVVGTIPPIRVPQSLIRRGPSPPERPRPQLQRDEDLSPAETAHA
jgi:capsular polysaccharide biosynthesis protein